MQARVGWVIALLGIIGAPSGATAEDPRAEHFERRIRPVLVEHCAECHSSGAKSVKGGLRVDDREAIRRGGETGPAVVPGKPEESLILDALRHDGLEMPPKGRLGAKVVADFERWIADGAYDPRESKAAATPREPAPDLASARAHWAFRPPVAVEPPATRDRSWPLDPIDRFILARLERAKLEPSADADRATWHRRVALDLIGLPPTPEEQEAFENDARPGAHERVVDRLLASREFAERWARHWLDLTGYADQVGTSNDIFAEHAWRYRDYLIDSIAADVPFDRFVREQIAGDLLPAASEEERARNLTATGFLLVGDVEVVNPDKLKMESDHIDQQVDKIGRVFMGMTVGCARCHDHKFDPIAQRDYYAMAGILRAAVSTMKIPNGIWSGLHTVELPETTEQLSDRERATRIHAAEMARRSAEEAVRRGEKQAAEAKIATAEKAGDAAAKAAAIRDRDAAAARLATLASEQAHARFFAPDVPRAYGLIDASTVAEMPIHIRGNPHTPGAVVRRGTIRALDWTAERPMPAAESGRRELAEWLVDPRHPLTARVAVNRVWQKLFGRGLVGSVDYFGIRGEQPSHPELLDHLAIRFMKEGWSRKRLIRSIVLSRTYRLGSERAEAAEAVDPDNRLLARMSRRRLEAEAIRDAMLAASGELARGGRGPCLPLEYRENTFSLEPFAVNPPAFRLQRMRPRQAVERTIFLPVVRSSQPKLARVRDVFDFTLPAEIAGERPVTIAATQSLFLLNDEEVRVRAEALARRVMSESASVDARLERLWRLAYQRPITPEERVDAIALLSTLDAHASRPGETAGWVELAHALLASNEFLIRF
ncbi:MAG: PSD1 and planctomycete cytochrome C domain-containing protein [Isosphaeraceae bacterium]|nr:PSD1 and planctomycete cytochrome C domain-containing protein [Isosphaeraceae bacterium]